MYFIDLHLFSLHIYELLLFMHGAKTANLPIKDVTEGPKGSITERFHCIYTYSVSLIIIIKKVEENDSRNA